MISIFITYSFMQSWNFLRIIFWIKKMIIQKSTYFEFIPHIGHIFSLHWTISSKSWSLHSTLQSNYSDLFCINNCSYASTKSSWLFRKQILGTCCLLAAKNASLYLIKLRLYAKQFCLDTMKEVHPNICQRSIAWLTCMNESNTV